MNFHCHLGNSLEHSIMNIKGEQKTVVNRSKPCSKDYYNNQIGIQNSPRYICKAQERLNQIKESTKSKSKDRQRPVSEPTVSYCSKPNINCQNNSKDSGEKIINSSNSKYLSKDCDSHQTPECNIKNPLQIRRTNVSESSTSKFNAYKEGTFSICHKTTLNDINNVIQKEAPYSGQNNGGRTHLEQRLLRMKSSNANVQQELSDKIGASGCLATKISKKDPEKHSGNQRPINMSDLVTLFKENGKIKQSNVGNNPTNNECRINKPIKFDNKFLISKQKKDDNCKNIQSSIETEGSTLTSRIPRSEKTVTQTSEEYQKQNELSTTYKKLVDKHLNRFSVVSSSLAENHLSLSNITPECKVLSNCRCDVQQKLFGPKLFADHKDFKCAPMQQRLVNQRKNLSLLTVKKTTK